MTRRRSAFTGLAILLGLTLVLPAVPALGETDLGNLDGRWRLDWDRSESFDAVLEAMEVGWFMRRLAGVARVDVEILGLEPECDTCPRRLELTFSSPISDRTEIVLLDGEPRPGKDPQGHDTIDRYQMTDSGAVEMVRERELPSGKAARLVETRSLGEAPNSMVSVLVVFIDGEQRTSVRRIFERTGDTTKARDDPATKSD